jgi:hypothetical protein
MKINRPTVCALLAACVVALLGVSPAAVALGAGDEALNGPVDYGDWTSVRNSPGHVVVGRTRWGTQFIPQKLGGGTVLELAEFENTLSRTTVTVTFYWQPKEASRDDESAWIEVGRPVLAGPRTTVEVRHERRYTDLELRLKTSPSQLGGRWTVKCLVIGEPQ